jgi:hypothetical protein
MHLRSPRNSKCISLRPSVDVNSPSISDEPEEQAALMGENIHWNRARKSAFDNGSMAPPQRPVGQDEVSASYQIPEQQMIGGRLLLHRCVLGHGAAQLPVQHMNHPPAKHPYEDYSVSGLVEEREDIPPIANVVRFPTQI